jgi:hypothetical protein
MDTILLSIPVVGYIYSPVAGIHYAALAVRWVMFPLIVLSGLWMWKGAAVKRWVKKRKTAFKKINN